MAATETPSTRRTTARPNPRPSSVGRRVRRSSSTVKLERLALAVAIVLAWQFVATSGWVPPIVARTPGEVWNALVVLVRTGTLWPAFWSTFSATLIAMTLASVVGIGVGIGLGLAPRLSRLLDPYLSAANAMPRIALAPVLIIYFGIGQTGKIALAFSIVVFVLLINAQAGVLGVDAELLKLASTMDMSRRQTIGKIILPSAVPSIFAGLRLGLIYSLLGVTASELIAAEQGLGQLIAGSTGRFDLATAYAVMIVLAITGALINVVMSIVESRLLRWKMTGT